MVFNFANDILLGDKQCERVFLGNQIVWERSGQREKNGILPYTFYANGEDIIDWQLTALEENYGILSNNKLNYKPIADGELTNNVNPESYPDDFCYIYTRHDSTSDALSIPNGPATEDYQRWYYLECTVNDYWHKVRDYRNKTYDWCNWKGHLEPGTYKLICECTDPYGYANSSNNPDPTMIDDHAYYALIDSNDNILVEVAWEDFFYPETRPFVRKESVFTVNSSIDVGVLSKMWKVKSDNIASLSWRFMIMPSDVENIEFEIQSAFPGVVYSGESCWEPYGYIIPIIIRHIESCYYSTANGVRYATNSGAYRLADDVSETIVKIPIENPLASGETITMTDTGMIIPTYFGENYLDVMLDGKPRMKIVYNVDS